MPRPASNASSSPYIIESSQQSIRTLRLSFSLSPIASSSFFQTIVYVVQSSFNLIQSFVNKRLPFSNDVFLRLARFVGLGAIICIGRRAKRLERTLGVLCVSYFRLHFLWPPSLLHSPLFFGETQRSRRGRFRRLYPLLGKPSGAVRPGQFRSKHYSVRRRRFADRDEPPKAKILLLIPHATHPRSSR